MLVYVTMTSCVPHNVDCERDCLKTVRHCGLVVSAPAWDGTGCEFDSWQCRIYPMFIEPTITWVPSGFSGHILLDSKMVLKNSFDYPNTHRLTAFYGDCPLVIKLPTLVVFILLLLLLLLPLLLLVVVVVVLAVGQ